MSDVDGRSALIQLTMPDYNASELNIEPSEFQYQLQLSEKKDDDSSFTEVYRLQKLSKYKFHSVIEFEVRFTVEFACLQVKQERHFNFLLGAKFFFFSMPPDY